MQEILKVTALTWNPAVSCWLKWSTDPGAVGTDPGAGVVARSAVVVAADTAGAAVVVASEDTRRLFKRLCRWSLASLL